jgi:hypothetical protein
MNRRFAALELKLERIERKITLAQWMLALLLGGIASLIVKAFA